MPATNQPQSAISQDNYEYAHPAAPPPVPPPFFPPADFATVNTEEYRKPGSDSGMEQNEGQSKRTTIAGYNPVELMKSFSKPPQPEVNPESTSRPVSEPIRQRLGSLIETLSGGQPTSKAFIILGSGLIILALLTIPFTNPFIWLITTLAATVQLGLGTMLKSKN